MCATCAGEAFPPDPALCCWTVLYAQIHVSISWYTFLLYKLTLRSSGLLYLVDCDIAFTRAQECAGKDFRDGAAVPFE